MTQGMKVKMGAEYLSECSLDVLEQIHRQLSHGKARQMVWAAILRRKGKTCEAIGNAIDEIRNYEMSGPSPQIHSLPLR